MKKEYFKRYETPYITKKAPPPHRPFNFELDDILLLAIIFILVTEEDPDIISILALVFLFLN